MPDAIHHGIVCTPGRETQDLVVINDILLNDAYKTALIGSAISNPEVVVDVGAHIGCFSVLWYRKNPRAKFICVEACPENIPALRKNVGSFSSIHQAACTYEQGPLYLLNAHTPNCRSTGGSIVASEAEVDACLNPDYYRDKRPLDLITIGEILDLYRMPRIDVLKLDCEGSEFSILEHAPLDRIGFIFVESHDPPRWRDLIKRRFEGWDIGMMEGGSFGCEVWHMLNPKVRGF